MMVITRQSLPSLLGGINRFWQTGQESGPRKTPLPKHIGVASASVLATFAFGVPGRKFGEAVTKQSPKLGIP